MKKMKKFLSMLVAATMTLAMAAPSFAAPGDPGKITIPNATIGADYAAYKLFDANPDGDNISYTATEEQYQALNGDDSPFVFTKNTANTYNVALKTEPTPTDQAVIDYLKEFNPAESGLFTKEAETLKTETVKIEWNVPYGYYFVTSSLGTVVSIDSTNREATIIDKNQSGPEWGTDGGKKILTSDGKVEEISANYGDTVNFEILFKTTNYAGEKEIETYFVRDSLAKGMAYKKDSVKVYVGDEKLADTAYVTTFTEATDTEGSKFEISIPWKNDTAFLYDSPSTIKVTYDVVVGNTEDTVIAGIGNVNTAKFSYKAVGDTDETTSDTWEDTATTYTFALAINKTNKSGNGLAGATFEVTDSNGSNVPVKETETPGIYVYDATAATNTVVSPEGGVIVIKGVKEGQYTLTETKAPEGYNVLTDPETIAASIESKTTYTTETTVYYNKDGNVVETEVAGGASREVTTTVPVSLITVVNFAGTMLPSTGGIGTTIFYAAGIILMAGAVFFVVRRKRA